MLNLAQVKELVIAGWTGRDVAALEKHIRELEAIGVKRPKTTPIFYRVAASLLTNDDTIEALGDQSSGEVEGVGYSVDDGLFVGVDSDHTDRKAEAVGVSLSKQMCAKPVSRDVWRLEMWPCIGISSSCARMSARTAGGGFIRKARSPRCARRRSCSSFTAAVRSRPARRCFAARLRFMAASRRRRHSRWSWKIRCCAARSLTAIGSRRCPTKDRRRQWVSIKATKSFTRSI